MFPSDFVESTTIAEENVEVGNDFIFDYETGQHILKNSVLVLCTSKESIMQFIQNVLRTKANAYEVYVKGETETFGVSVYEHIGNRTLPMGYLNSELKREVTENLLRHPYITDVSNWIGKRERRGLDITFTVTTADDDIYTINEVV